ncbi:MAG TPA: Trm112 family protein [Longimicrobiales bacterium]|nr:Trm112 family protein [Longimicrobiales bacterium]
MNILLTDILTCPRCGPGYGLILVADRMESRRVLDGWLGCPNCRERYPVRGGVADLRAGASDGVGEATDEASGSEAYAWRLAALMGVTEGPGFTLIAGPGVGAAGWIAGAIEGLEVIALGDWVGGGVEEAGVSRVASGAALPFYDRSILAVALTGGTAAALLGEAVRVLAPTGRLVLDPAPADSRERLAAAGLHVLVEGDGAIVAARGVAV